MGIWGFDLCFMFFFFFSDMVLRLSGGPKINKVPSTVKSFMRTLLYQRERCHVCIQVPKYWGTKVVKETASGGSSL